MKLRVFKRLAIGAVGNRTYGGRMSRSGDRGISIALAIHSFDPTGNACRDREIAPTENAISNSVKYMFKVTLIG